MKVDKLKADRFRKARGGRSKLLKISCESCGSYLFSYQKDGPGILKRLYLDRIDNPKFHMKLNLLCPNCKFLIGVPITYKKESRPAYRLFAGSVTKSELK